MNSKRTTLGIIAIGCASIVVVAYFMFVGKIATREYNKAATSTATSKHFEDTTAK